MHLSTLPETERHLRDSRHSRLLVLEQKKQTAALMPMPTQEIVDVIEELVQNLYECSRIDEKDLEIRLAAFSYLQKKIENVFPGYSIRLYGSTFTGIASHCDFSSLKLYFVLFKGFGLKDSDVNVSLVFVEPKDEPISRLMIINIFNWLQTNPIWIKVVEDFNCRVPIIRFTHQQLNVSFSLVIEEESSYKTGVLFKEYQQLDSRFAVLTVAFRTFARICGLDKPDFGSLPSHAFNLMVLHYLQQVKVLPVLHSSIESETYKSICSLSLHFMNIIAVVFVFQAPRSSNRISRRVNGSQQVKHSDLSGLECYNTMPANSTTRRTSCAFDLSAC